MINTVVIMGRLVADPELRHTPSDTAVTSFTVAVDRSYVSKSSANGERTTDFIDVVAWRNTAEFVCKYFHKGQMIALNGSLQTRTYTDSQGNKRKATEIVADNVSFTESKRESAGTGSYQNYQNANGAPSYNARPEPAAEPAPAYSSGSQGDFEEIPMDDDLPF